MKRKIGVAALSGLLMAGAFATAALADCAYPVLIAFDNDTYAYETNFANYTSGAGSQLTVVGKITCFSNSPGPLSYLNGQMPANEFTMIWTGTSLGTVVTHPFGGDSYQTDYTGVTFKIYRDPSNNAPSAAVLLPYPNAQVPANFIDGQLIGSGAFTFFHTSIKRSTTNVFTSSVNTIYHFDNSNLEINNIMGGANNSAGQGWCSLGLAVGQCTLPAGYSVHPYGVFDYDQATASAPASWGRLKMLYR